MNLNDVTNIFNLLSKVNDNVECRNECLKLRKSALQNIGTITKQKVSLAFDNTSKVSLAFDTRRIDQEVEYNPRRGLQNYSRSEAFITEATQSKLENFAKLRDILSNLKNRYGKEPEWQDSNVRILLSSIDKGLRTNINDGDYTGDQPGTGNLNYLDELLHVRYRLDHDQIKNSSVEQLNKILLAKDEDLLYKNINGSVTKTEISNNNYDDLVTKLVTALGIVSQQKPQKKDDDLLEKLFGTIKATKENKNVERSVNIIIKDSIKDEPIISKVSENIIEDNIKES